MASVQASMMSFSVTVASLKLFTDDSVIQDDKVFKLPVLLLFSRLLVFSSRVDSPTATDCGNIGKILQVFLVLIFLFSLWFSPPPIADEDDDDNISCPVANFWESDIDGNFCCLSSSSEKLAPPRVELVVGIFALKNFPSLFE